MALPAYAARAGIFDPRHFAGLQAWYDAADSASITLDGGRVSQWSDKSGNARHATNTTSGSTQPSYTTAGRNGLNVLTFEAASVQRLTVAGTSTFNFLHNGTESLVFAICKYGTVSNPNAVYLLYGNNSNNNSAFVGTACAMDNRSGVAVGGLSVAVTSGTAFVANTNNAANTGYLPAYENILTPNSYVVQEFALSVNATSAERRIRVRLNGGAEIAANQKTAAASSANAGFAMQFGAGGNSSLPLQGDICELMFFNQQPTDAVRDLIRRYLGAKWGVTVQ